MREGDKPKLLIGASEMVTALGREPTKQECRAMFHLLLKKPPVITKAWKADPRKPKSHWMVWRSDLIADLQRPRDVFEEVYAKYPPQDWEDITVELLEAANVRKDEWFDTAVDWLERAKIPATYLIEISSGIELRSH